MKEIILSSVVALFILNGCGDSTSTSTTDNGGENLLNETTEAKKIGTGYYVDSPVKGIDYLCGSESGTTDINGTFTFEEGKNCSFKIGDLTLREISASSLEDKITILEDNVEVAQLLQTLDMDGDASNGITIDKRASSTVVADINIEEIPTELAVLDSIKEALKAENEEYRGRVKTREEAKAHLDATEKDLKDRGIKTQRRELEENRPDGGKDSTENRPTNRDDVKDSTENRPDNRDDVKDSTENRPTNRDDAKDLTENRPDNRDDAKDLTENRPTNRDDAKDLTENRPENMENNQGERR